MISQSIVIIPARGGSKRFPGKNIALLADKPLIAYAITAAKAARRIGGVYVTTDDEDIASIAREWGAEIPCLRPPELAGDQVTADEAVAHLIGVLDTEHGVRPDNVVLIQPTSPFVTPSQIDVVITRLDESAELDSVTTMSPLDHRHHPYNLAFAGAGASWEFAFPEERAGARSRQAKPIALKFCNLFAARTDIFLSYGRFGPRKGAVLVDELYSWDIDFEWQIKLAEFMLETGLVDLEKPQAGLTLLSGTK